MKAIEKDDLWIENKNRHEYIKKRDEEFSKAQLREIKYEKWDDVCQERCFYSKSLIGFINEKPGEWLNYLKDSYIKDYKKNCSFEQINAWKDSYLIIIEFLNNMEISERSGRIIFEYHFKNGRRADCIIVLNGMVYIIEFKVKSYYEKKDLSQIKRYAYLTKLELFKGFDIRKILILSLVDSGFFIEEGDIVICSGKMLSKAIH
ncbi:PD-(D/E)XK nuclease domain-containing protein [Butyrivibrio sp. WCE2006]|uniref:PD-(D/E)XK nuclease domain-containing protein n=1 Tax=Butyrivibrio sp. WCE2006 TaxID=1410611 RepID=UPI0005D1917A|nr:PD-(D/E)XK nuclease domain-containing protein [Butyrivibrio sp. WCE2006]